MRELRHVGFVLAMRCTKLINISASAKNSYECNTLHSIDTTIIPHKTACYVCTFYLKVMRKPAH